MLPMATQVLGTPGTVTLMALLMALRMGDHKTRGLLGASPLHL